VVDKKNNWIYYMQQGLKNMWKSKEVPDYRSITKESKINKSDKKKFLKSLYWALGFIGFILWVQIVWVW
jgi:hypothetical protein